MNGRPPKIFEDGKQLRDFVSVHDVADACLAALEAEEAVGEVVNVGSGTRATITEIAERLAAILGREDCAPEVTGVYRVGDVRHCFADIAKAEKVLGWRPKIDLEEGLTELVEWLDGQTSVDSVDEAAAELAARGLTV